MRSYNIGKKAQADETLVHLPIMFYVIYVVVVIAVLLNLFIAKSVNIEQTELKIISSRMIHESSYYDPELERFVEGTIDFNKAKEEEFDKNINYAKANRIAAKITMVDNSIDYNSKLYTRIRPRAGYDATLAKTNIFLIDGSGSGKYSNVEVVT
jgi:hypothetical protein